jgi:dihydrofolate reductase
MKIVLIAALSENGTIGDKGKIPWHISADLKRLKQIAMGHTVIMGRKTFESIGKSLPLADAPLPHTRARPGRWRHNIPCIRPRRMGGDIP